MRRLWLLLLPLLFVPDLGAMERSDVGTGELADYMVGPYLVAVLAARVGESRGAWRRMNPLLLGFIVWALLSTLTINVRYGYSEFDYLTFGLVKVGKLIAYGLAGLMTVRALEHDKGARSWFPWSLLASAVVMAGSLIALRGVEVARDSARLGFSAGNGMSVALAGIYAWMAAYWVSPNSSRNWCVAAAIAAPALLLGFFFSDGRGGWVSALVAGIYIAIRFQLRPAVIAVMLFGAIALVVTYESEAGFRGQIDITFDPSRLNYQSDFAASTGFDDGSRIQIWTHEAPRIVESPLLGTGLFHRGGRSGLWSTGSHNFWLQMFLETGVVGGTLVLVIVWQMWRAAGSTLARAAGVGIAGRAALIAALVGGMTGEYFYGGKPLLSLLLVLAPCLSLPLAMGVRARQPAGSNLLRPVSG